MLKRISSKFLKITAFILGGILLLMTAFHFWFINHAEGLIENMVHAQSNGRIRLKVDKFKFNWFSYNMELRKANFSSTDSAAATTYEFNIPRVGIRLKEIIPLVFEKRILIDSLHVFNPDIRVIRLRSKDSTAAPDSAGLSLPHEMGRIYNSIQDALKVLKVDRFRIDKGKFSLINKISPGDPPVVITDINFQLDNLQVDSTKPGSKRKILFSDNVALHTSNQNILFPDGRHRLSFRSFRINILNRIVEFDSCTVVATRDDSTGNSFQVFFDKLQMTNIDFATLYHNEVIKADSVYCINPRFRLDVNLQEQEDPLIKAPRLDELVRQLTGNMQLAFVVVENAAIDINTTRAGRVNSFTSDNNNFELQGLQISKYGAQPLTVKKFVMAIRNYENFLRDSTYSMQFDSIFINDNRISLNNFNYEEYENGKVINNLRMPQFELEGLSWDDLVFNKKFTARKVNLYRPVINYAVIGKKNNAKDVFETLAGVGHFMQLDNLDITDGQVNLFFKNNIRLHLENADISVLGKRLVDSRKLKNIQSSVTSLHFKKGVFKMRQLTAELADVSFTGSPNNQLHAGTLHIRNHDELDITAKDARIQSMIINDDIQQSAIRGISWKEADIRLHSFPRPTSNSSAIFLLNDIKGENTRFSITDSSKSLAVYLRSLKADELATTKGNKVTISGLSAIGNDLKFANAIDKLNIKDFSFSDQHTSIFKNIQFTRNSSTDSVSVLVPELEVVPDINNIIDGKINARLIEVRQPKIHINLVRTHSQDNIVNPSWPEATIGKLVIDEPVLQYSRTNDEGTTTLNWEGKDNRVEFTDLFVSDNTAKSLSAGGLNLSLQNFAYRSAKGKTINAGNGKLLLVLNKLKLQHNDVGAWDWAAMIKNMEAKDFIIDSLGKKNGKLSIENARLADLTVSSANLLNLREILRSNKSFRLQGMTGSYHNDDNQFNWYNTGYDKNTRFFSADSFSYRPTKDLEAFTEALVYQADFIKARTGAISIGPFDIDRYAIDSVLDLGVLTINDASLSDFRDKRKPRKPGIVRFLPVNLLKNIPVRVLADTVKLNNTHVIYEEVNEKTGATGKIIVAALNGRITHMRNYNLFPGDSLHINATALLENKLFTNLQLKESYTDSLGGFLMLVKMDSADLRIFNPVLKPLISAELKSGWLDSMSMRVNGREAFATGEMKMIYRDLKIRVTGNEQKKQLFGGRIKSFFANTLVKNRNSKRTGTVFTHRLRDRSAVNYLVKIAFSGISSSIGIKKADRLARKNKKLVEQGL